MSLNIAQNLLQQYNKDDPYKKASIIDQRADQSNRKFGTWSYANMYDALYDKFSQYKNFNDSMWHTALKLGEQDQYLAFLEQNKDTTLSPQFYDPTYYDYEAMMLKLYLPFANSTNKEERFHEVYDAANNEFLQESLGDMSDYEYIQYQLNNARELRTGELTRELEQWRKDQMTFFGKLAHTGLATGAELGEGLLAALAGTIDFVAAVGTGGLLPYATSGGEDNYLDAFVNYFGERGLTALEKRTVREALDEYERTHTFIRDIDGNTTKVGVYMAGIANSIGMMVPAIVLNIVTQGAAAPATTALFYSSIFSTNMHEVATNPETANSPALLKIFNVTLKTGVEAAIEYALGKVLGSTIPNKLIGIGGKGLSRGAITSFGKASGVKYLLKSAVQEGLEEFLQDFGTNCVDQFCDLLYEGYGNNGVTIQTLIDSFCVGALSSMVMAGGQVTANSIKSSAINTRAKYLDEKKPLENGVKRYNAELDIGPGDLVIEVDGKPKKVKGLQRLAYSQILSDFQEAVDKLKKSDKSITENMELAEEVYGAVSAISQFYASFDEQRIKNCELLLNRIAETESRTLFGEKYGYAATILSPSTIANIVKSDESLQVKKSVTSKTFATYVEETFRSMVGDVAARHSAKLRVATEKVEDKLKTGGVTETKEFINIDGERFKKDPEMKELEERLGKKATNVLDELRKGYEWVITTDGHIAVEKDGYLFVSESWLQNYKVTDIYKYLEQTKVLDALTGDKTLAPMVKKLVAFYKEFAGQKDATAEQAMMELLFNESVYQGFLLSNGGKNVHEYKNFIFQIHEMVKDLANRSKYQQQLFKGKQAQVRINLLNQIYEQIKETMRKPTVKAILNWGFDPQAIAADSVLTPRDKEVIKGYKKYRETITNGGKQGKASSAHKYLLDEIVKQTNSGSTPFNEKQLEIIQKHKDGTATLDEDLEAVALLDEADRRISPDDFEYPPEYYYHINRSSKLRVAYFRNIDKENLIDLIEIEMAVREYVNELWLEYSRTDSIVPPSMQMNILFDEWFRKYAALKQNNSVTFNGKPFWSGSVSLLDGIIEEVHTYEEAENTDFHHSMYFSETQQEKMQDGDNAFFWVDNGEIQGDWREKLDPAIISKIKEQIQPNKESVRDKYTAEDFRNKIEFGLNLIEEYSGSIARKALREVGLGAFTVPYQAISPAINDGNIAESQFVTDKLDEFKQTYGISARQMIMGDLIGMSAQQRNQLMQDMEILKVDNIVTFVVRKLESMLGNKYVVTPTTKQLKNAVTTGDFTVASFSNSTLRDYGKLLQRVKGEINKWFTNVLDPRREKWLRDPIADRELDTIVELLSDFSANGYSMFNEFLSEDAIAFDKEFGRMLRSSNKSIEVIKWLGTQKTRIDKIFNDVADNIGLTNGFEDTGIYDFVIAKAIPAESIISQDILELGIDQRNRVFSKMFEEKGIALEVKIRNLLDISPDGLIDIMQTIYEKIIHNRSLTREYIDEVVKTFTPLNSRVEAGEDPFMIYEDLLKKLLMGTDPITGEEIIDEFGEIFNEELKNIYYDNDVLIDALFTFDESGAALKLSDIIDISKFSGIDLSTVRVEFGDAGHGLAGYYSPSKRLIVISNRYDGDLFGTFVHEVNHCLQHHYNLPGGFNDRDAMAMPDLLCYVANHYPNFVEYAFMLNGYRDIYDYMNISNITEKRLRKLPYEIQSILALCAYRLVQGEVWARAYMHNGKPVHGFAEIWNGIGPKYLLTPDGKTKFRIRYSESDESSKSMSQTSPKVPSTLAGSALDVAIQKLFLMKKSQEFGEYEGRDTYHSYLTRGDTGNITRELLSPTVPFLARYTVRLAHIIQNAEQYLAPEILARCNGDFSEGNVFFRIKEYVEEKYEGISIDRKDTLKEDYVFVDDNAFDDLLNSATRNKRNDGSTSIVSKYKPGEHIALSDFYSQQELDRLGINPSAYIVIEPGAGSETIFDYKRRSGVIVLDVNSKTTNAAFINELNHEFRHLLQYYNGFATGFTPDFKVTTEMLNDVKKHLPETFKNKEIVKWAKEKAARDGVKNYEELIVQRVIYYSTIGEINAYGFNAGDLYAKPTYVNTEAGNPTIFMPWYNAETGEGRYKTEFLAMRAEKSQRIKLPKVEKKAKDTRPRTVSKARAKDNNLKYYKYHQRIQLAPVIQDFVIATTGHEDQLPPDLWHSIETGKLTLQSFYKWFRKVKASEVNDFTFKLINKYIFKNDYISSMSELDSLLTFDPAFYWAAAIVLRNEGMELESLIKENDVNKFVEFLKTVEGSKWHDKIFEIMEKFTLFETGTDDNGKPIYEDIVVDSDTTKMMRVLTMYYFDGTLAGAFYVGNAFKDAILKREMEHREKYKSADAILGNGMSDDKDVSYLDTISNEDAVLDANSRAVGNDITALYELHAEDADRFIEQIVHEKYLYDVDNLVNELNLPEKATITLKQRLSDPETLRKEYAKLKKQENRTEQEEKRLKNYAFALNKYKTINESLSEFTEKLKSLSISEIIARGTDLVVAQLADTVINPDIFNLDKRYEKTFSTDTKAELSDGKLKTDRVNVQTRIKNTGKTISKFLKDGDITIDQLPKDIADMFEQIVTEKNGHKRIEYRLKQSVYSVGRGRVTLKGEGTGRAFYVPKHNITEGNEAYRHSTEAILEVDALLRATVKEIRKFVKTKKEAKQSAEKHTENLEQRLARAEAKIRRLQEKNQDLKQKNEHMHNTEIVVNKKKKRISDTPNIFNISSSVEMPYQLRKIFDVSFEAMADTKVQFASRDEKTGELYNKEEFSEKEFNSRIKHEVTNWDAFYEANRETLLNLTRNDVLDIIEFFHAGAVTIDGPSGKLGAFEIFILGYIVDGARRNFNNWSFSEDEITTIEKLYEQKASIHGSGLNAVQQMLKVVDPMKKIRQRMFHDWDAISDEDKDNLIERIDELQAEKDAKRRKVLGEEVINTLHEFGNRQLKADRTTQKLWSKAWWHRLASRLKSTRYLFMLSGPTTWIRNVLSNVILLGFNKSADLIGRLVFLPKGYRKSQWELSKVRISSEAKTFIDTYINGNKIFDSLYDMSTKYDPRHNKKQTDERGLLVDLITRAYEKEYAQNNRFNKDAMNWVGKFVDRMIGDKRFIKFVTRKYFGKILTVEAQRGNVDLSQGLSSEALDLFANSVILANQEYMHKRSFAADFLDGIREKYPAAYEILSFWQPFLNSSFNWFAETLKYTPLGLANSIRQMCRLEKTIAKLDERRAKGEMVTDSRAVEFLARRDIGKGILGLLLSGLGIILAFSGRLRIDEDDDKFYLYIDETVKLDITSLLGSSSVLIGACITQKWIEQSDGETASTIDVLEMMTNTMFDGFIAADILNRHRWGQGFWDDLLTETESVLRSFIPQIWQTIVVCTNNEGIRYSPGVKGMFERWINSFTPTQPLGNRKVNPYTGEIESEYAMPIVGDLLAKGLVGSKVYWVEISEQERMCREYGVNKNELTGELTVNGKKIELDRLSLNKKYGELNKESLSIVTSQKHLVEMPDGTFKTLSWDKMSDLQRSRVLSKVMTQNAEIAKIYVWTQLMNKKVYVSSSLWAELKLLGITRNVYKGDKGFVE